jgi:hypothetical protein
MCIYYTYHWSCCPGTARPAQCYMHIRCAHAMQPKPYGIEMRNGELDTKKCEIEHRVLDGSDHNEPCPRCGAVTLDEEEEGQVERTDIGR